MMIDSAQKDKLIDKIRQIEDPEILDEIQRLLEIEFDDKPYMTNEEQREAIRGAREQIQNREIIDEEQANNQIDAWLNK
jgi:hypothetical protein